MVLNYIIWI